jgi:serine/threonine protein kinase/CRP-like cAMP-binding protein
LTVEQFEDLVNFLRKVPLFFKQLPQDDIPKVAALLSTRQYKPGEVVVRQGTMPKSSRAFFIVQAGTLVLQDARNSAQDENEEDATLGPTDYFGATTLIESRPYFMTVKAGEEGARVLCLSIEHFDELGFRSKLKLPKRAACYRGGLSHHLSGLSGHLYSIAQAVDHEPAEVEFIASALKRSPNLKLDEEQRLQLALGARLIVRRKGEEIFKCGSSAFELLIVKSGQVSLVRNDKMDEEEMMLERQSNLKVAPLAMRKMATMDKLEKMNEIALTKRHLRKEEFLAKLADGAEDLSQKGSGSVRKPRQRAASAVLHDAKAFHMRDWVESSLNGQVDAAKIHGLVEDGGYISHGDMKKLRCRTVSRGYDVKKTARPTRSERLRCGEAIRLKSVGSSFGEISCLYNMRRTTTATVVSDEDAVLYVISKRNLQKCLAGRADEAKEEERVRLLDEVSLLSGLLRSERQELARHASGELFFQPGELVLQEGQVPTLRRWYIIMSGSAVKYREESETRIILERGCHFGESSIKSGQFPHHSVEAGERGMVCLCIDGEVLQSSSILEEILKEKEARNHEDYIRKVKGTANKNFYADYNIDVDNLVPICELGTGGFADVLLFEDSMEEDKRYAVKRTSKRLVNRLGVQKHLCKERDILSMLDSDFVIKLLCSFRDSRSVYMVLEAALGGSLEQLIASRNGPGCNPLNANEVRFYAAGVTLGIQHLHERRIGHRDLKPGNVLLNEQGHVKICDMGFARFILHKTYTCLGTPEYMAPEIIVAPHEHDHMVDMWSIGILTYELLAGKVPFPPDSECGNDMLVVRNQQRVLPKMPSNTPKSAENFVRMLLIEDPSNRMCSADALKHSWFDQLPAFDLEMMRSGSIVPPHLPAAFETKSHKPARCGDDFIDRDEAFEPLSHGEWSTSSVRIKAAGDLTVFNSLKQGSGGIGSAVSASSSVVRISKPSLDASSKSCNGMVRFGLTSNPDDDHDFQHGYYIGLVPSLGAPEAGDKHYLVSGNDPEMLITLALDTSCGPAVLQNGSPVHIFTNASPCTGSMYAKVFIYEAGDRVPLEALTEPIKEDTVWEQAFNVPRAARSLKQRTTMSMEAYSSNLWTMLASETEEPEAPSHENLWTMLMDETEDS